MLDWNSNRDMWMRVLQQQTGQSLDYWTERLADEKFAEENALRIWLTEQSISGYAANLLVMETFGYPDWLKASADELIEHQYADRAHLRPIFDAVIAAVSKFGEFTIQTRKSYVSLLTPKRTFARIRASTKNRVDVGLRLRDVQPGGRLAKCTMQATMQVQIGLTALDEFDVEVKGWLRRAYNENL